MKYMTQKEEELDNKLSKKEAECIELYNMLDSKYTQIAELIKENTEAISLLKNIYTDRDDRPEMRQIEEFLN